MRTDKKKKEKKKSPPLESVDSLPLLIRAASSPSPAPQLLLHLQQSGHDPLPEGLIAACCIAIEQFRQTALDAFVYCKEPRLFAKHLGQGGWINARHVRRRRSPAPSAVAARRGPWRIHACSAQGRVSALMTKCRSPRGAEGGRGDCGAAARAGGGGR